VRTRLTFIGLWTACDDEGRYRYEPELLKADLWPFEGEVTAEDVEADAWELAKRSLVCVYDVEGKRYLHIVNWREHQKINRPTPSRLPECSRRTHGGFPEDSSPRARAREVDLERETEKEQGSTTLVEQARPIDDATRVFHAWQASTGRHRANLDANRRQAIAAALKAYPVEDAIDAVQGWANDPWPDRPQQNDITQLLHMGSKRKPLNVLEKMRDLWRNGPPPVRAGPTRASRQLDQARQTYEEMMADVPGGMGEDRGPPQPQLARPADHQTDR
jgi:hypothetical protein